MACGSSSYRIANAVARSFFHYLFSRCISQYGTRDGRSFWRMDAVVLRRRARGRNIAKVEIGCEGGGRPRINAKNANLKLFGFLILLFCSAITQYQITQFPNSLCC
jgi:hypothetical protein